TSAEIGSGPASSSAHSEYRVLERYEEGCTLMSVRITTGVTHQIRVHMAQGLGHPIVGDKKYTPS
ncbi:ribosomal pseudouridine synthase, putative, partial [Perkinsus marinus ATCC 50983]